MVQEQPAAPGPNHLCEHLAGGRILSRLVNADASQLTAAFGPRPNQAPEIEASG